MAAQHCDSLPGWLALSGNQLGWQHIESQQAAACRAELAAWEGQPGRAAQRVAAGSSVPGWLALPGAQFG